MTNVSTHPASIGRSGIDDTQVIDGGGYDRLWRAQQAAQLLAAINQDVAANAGINHDATAAVAEYLRDDMLEILNASRGGADALI